jgi:hypothetical protein
VKTPREEATPGLRQTKVTRIENAPSYVPEPSSMKRAEYQLKVTPLAVGEQIGDVLANYCIRAAVFRDSHHFEKKARAMSCKSEHSPGDCEVLARPPASHNIHGPTRERANIRPDLNPLSVEHTENPAACGVALTHHRWRNVRVLQTTDSREQADVSHCANLLIRCSATPVEVSNC